MAKRSRQFPVPTVGRDPDRHRLTRRAWARGARARTFMMSLHVSVLPAPDSPLTRIDWLLPAATICRKALSAVAYTCGLSSRKSCTRARRSVARRSTRRSEVRACKGDRKPVQAREEASGHRAAQCATHPLAAHAIRPHARPPRPPKRRADELAPRHCTAVRRTCRHGRRARCGSAHNANMQGSLAPASRPHTGCSSQMPPSVRTQWRHKDKSEQMERLVRSHRARPDARR